MFIISILVYVDGNCLDKLIKIDVESNYEAGTVHINDLKWISFEMLYSLSIIIRFILSVSRRYLPLASDLLSFFKYLIQRENFSHFRTFPL